jgi:hypothetical protein
VLPAFHVSRDPALQGELDALWDGAHFAPIERHGGAFWFETQAS